MRRRPPRSTLTDTLFPYTALVRSTDRAVVVHDAGRLRVNAHLVFERPDGHVVARSERTVLPDEELRSQEQADALDPLRRARQAREDQVDDIDRKSTRLNSSH